MTEQQPTLDAPSPYARLRVKYALIALYGLASSLVGITTITAVSGEAWGLAWPVLVASLALGAILGLSRSQEKHMYGWEISMTLSLLAVFCSYSVLIVLRTIHDGEVTRLPVALLPVILSVTPFARFLDIVRKK